MNQEPVIVEKTFHASVSAVWRALTDKEQMRQWYFQVSDFEPEVGFEFSFEGGEEGGQVFVHRCRVTEVIEEKKLSYTWRYEGYAGNSLVSFELFPEGDDTRVKVTHEGLHTFPDQKEFVRSNFLMGWTQIIGPMLGAFLKKS